MASPTLTNFRWILALFAALAVAAVVAVVVPRSGDSGTVNWLVTIGSGLAAAALVYVVLRPKGEITETRDRLSAAPPDRSFQSRKALFPPQL